MKNNKFDLSKFEKVEDLIYFDEVILSHLKLNKKNYFLYLVDNRETSDIFLLFEVEDKNIYDYLSRKISLKNLILENDLVHQIEEDFEGHIIDTQFLYTDQIKEEYFPSNDSYIEYLPSESSYYFEKLNQIYNKPYLQSLRKNAFFVKFSSENKLYGDTIGLNDLSNVLLSNLSSSFKNFLKIDFLKTFSNKIADDKVLSKIYKMALPYTDLRAVEFDFGSFEIGLSVDDILTTKIEDKDVKYWVENVGWKFKDIVLDDDMDNNELDEILTTYNDEERLKIFKPILNIIDNNKFNIQIKKTNSEKYKDLALNNRSIANRIITSIERPEQPQDFSVINMLTIIDKNKKKKTINLENTLFNNEQKTNIILHAKDFIDRGYNKIDSNLELVVTFENVNNKVFIKTEYDGNVFDVQIQSEKIDEEIKKLINIIYEYIINK
ncbi:hypothetical protein [Chryseobacterium cheonjiense]|uniref:Uncharacterized protein n=1 Tax=Chryseobacterium cheonjiense TaxID=2728845 RepID=A0A7Y0A518_9FLAO|nr:hypothetical protein [Chryseobacterium cheonjiense]NML56751.1 hypothetical protein [Chryseobacterium cheonjiense]